MKWGSTLSSKLFHWPIYFRSACTCVLLLTYLNWRFTVRFPTSSVRRTQCCCWYCAGFIVLTFWDTIPHHVAWTLHSKGSTISNVVWWDTAAGSNQWPSNLWTKTLTTTEVVGYIENVCCFLSNNMLISLSGMPKLSFLLLANTSETFLHYRHIIYFS